VANPSVSVPSVVISDRRDQSHFRFGIWNNVGPVSPGSGGFF